jgi:hydroxylaminobenzene mutase
MSIPSGGKQIALHGLALILAGLIWRSAPHRVGVTTVWVISVWLIWLMALSELANAWWGANQMLPVAAGQAGATGAAPWQELVVKLCHVPAAIGLIVSVLLLIIDVSKHREPA